MIPATENIVILITKKTTAKTEPCCTSAFCMYGYIIIEIIMTFPPPIKKVDRYSDSDIRKLIENDKIIAGFNSGISILFVISNVLPPSILACFSMSGFMPIRNDMNMCTEYGMHIIAWAITTAGILFIKLNLSRIAYTPIKRAVAGMNKGSEKSNLKNLLCLNFKTPRPVIKPITVAKIPVKLPTRKLFIMLCTKS